MKCQKTIKELAVSISGAILFCSPIVAVAVDCDQNSSDEQIISHCTGKQPSSGEKIFVDASDQAEGWFGQAGRSLVQGWNDKKKRFLVVGTGRFKSGDPAFDKAYIGARAGYYTYALLDAKAQIIEFFTNTMSAERVAQIPFSPPRTPFEQEIADLTEEISNIASEVSMLAKESDISDLREEDDFFSKRFVSLLDGLIKKVDETYSPEELDEKKREKLLSAQAKFVAAKSKHDELLAQIGELQATLQQESRAKVATWARHPLFGVTVLAQWESWNRENGQYEIALVAMWSPTIEAQVRAMMTGEDARIPWAEGITPPTMAQYLDDDWCSSIGSRRFRDPEGLVWILGIAADEIRGGGTLNETKAQEMALQLSRMETAMAVFADVEVTRQAEQVTQTFQKGDDATTERTQAAQAVGNYMREAIKDRQVPGSSVLKNQTCTHPISGRKLAVTISGVSSKSAFEALRLSEGSYVTAVLDGTHQQILKGTQAGKESAVAKARTDTRPAEVAEEAAKKRVNEGVEAAMGVAAPQPAQDSPEAVSGQSKSGTFKGAGQSDTDW